jgi:hypothetical protein
VSGSNNVKAAGMSGKEFSCVLGGGVVGSSRTRGGEIRELVRTS